MMLQRLRVTTAVLTLAWTTTGFAKVEVLEPIPYGDVRDWADKLSQTLNNRSELAATNYSHMCSMNEKTGCIEMRPGLTQCRFLEPGDLDPRLKNILLCASQRSHDMSAMLARASIYSEVELGKVVEIGNSFVNWVLTFVSGHDIPGFWVAPDGDFVREGARGFFQAIERDQLKLNDWEQEFYDEVYKKHLEEKSADNYVIVGVSTRGAYHNNAPSVASHEVIHGMYMLMDNFRQAVEKFWNDTVTEEHKDLFIRSLIRMYENLYSDQSRLLTEFASYMLEEDSKNDPDAGPIARIYEDQLRTFLKYRDIKLPNEASKPRDDVKFNEPATKEEANEIAAKDAARG